MLVDLITCTSQTGNFFHALRRIAISYLFLDSELFMKPAAVFIYAKSMQLHAFDINIQLSLSLLFILA